MSIFGNLRLEPVVQQDDLTRLSAIASTKSKDESAITLVEIEPDTGAGFIDVSAAGTLSADNWYLDWAYNTAATKTVSLRITTSGAPVTITKDINVLSAAVDKLFSNDDDLTKHEPDILNWVVAGRNTFLDYHRRAQSLILDYYRVNGYRNEDGTKVSKDELIDLSEVKEWSTFLVLKLIMLSRSNEVNDVFREKADDYASKMVEARESVLTSYDWNKDGSLSDDEKNVPNNVIEVGRT